MARFRIVAAFKGRQARGLGLAFVLLGWTCLWLPAPARAENTSALEYQVKAAFLFKFTSYVNWPAAAFADESSPISICIWGEDPFGTALDQIVKGETVNGRTLAVQRIRALPEPKVCQVVFVQKPEKDQLRALAARSPGTLTVGEGVNFLREGGMVAFVIEERRVRFDINQKAASACQLTLSSRLLSLARSVER